MTLTPYPVQAAVITQIRQTERTATYVAHQVPYLTALLANDSVYVGTMRWVFLLPLVAFGSLSCGESTKGTASSSIPTEVASSPADNCGSVRLTSYTASKGGWCEYDRTAPMLPESVRSGLTLAIAEPYNGSSYGGVSGEACGECWEIASLDATRIVMVHDLCPVEGNPVCNGSHFHFDVSTETAQALRLAGLDEASTRRVPCPVSGNAYLQLLDRNEWGYVRFQVINHRIPVRNVEFREGASGATYYPAERSGGAWAVSDHGEMFAKDGAGGSFRITSAQGEALEMPNLLTYAATEGEFFDLGAQFTDQAAPSGAECRFLPPADVYADGYGGIESVRWVMNPWAAAKPTETSSGCLSGRCLSVAGMGSGSGFHIYYRQSFSPTLFRSLDFAARTASGTFNVTLTGDGTTCKETSIPVSDAWSESSIDLANACADSGAVNSVTVYGATSLTLLLDNLRFVP